MKHIALTMGPIINTLSLGRKTAEIWAASYLFSSFMKGVINELRKMKDVEFIIPYVGDDAMFEPKDNGIGLFHDRFIFTTNTLSLNEVDVLLQKHKDNLSDMIASSIKRDHGKVRAYIDQYLQTYLIELDEVFKNPILDISKILDNVELHTPHLEADESYLQLFLNRNTILSSSLAKRSLGSNPSFKSIPEIAAQAMKIQNTKEEDDTQIYAALERDKENFKQVYKYIAIVHADGDNLSSYIKEQKDPTMVSKRLFEFDQKAVEVIEDYGATPIFVGGDDLLFFAPVMHGDETIFDVTDRLNTLFMQTMESKEATLSFGVSITYYKYPLYEALEHSRDALFYKAKKIDGKNATCITVRKHSGQSFETNISRNDEAYGAFKTLLEDVLLHQRELPHSIHHKLESYQPLLMQIPPERLEAAFENIFNEEIHQSKFKQGLEDIKMLMAHVGMNEQGFKKLHTLLSIIKLLRGDR